MKKSIEIGTVFGVLNVEKYIGVVNRNSIYLCKCNCGETRNVKLTNLLSGKVNSCGCNNYIGNKNHGNTKFTPIDAGFRAKASSYKALAKQRGIVFSLSVEETVYLLQQKCFYCDKQPSNKYNVRKLNRGNNNFATKNTIGYDILYSGIDRVNNKEGYTIGNSVSCCTQCNTAKLNFTLDEFKTWIKMVYIKTIKTK